MISVAGLGNLFEVCLTDGNAALLSATWSSTFFIVLLVALFPSSLYEKAFVEHLCYEHYQLNSKGGSLYYPHLHCVRNMRQKHQILHSPLHRGLKGRTLKSLCKYSFNTTVVGLYSLARAVSPKRRTNMPQTRAGSMPVRFHTVP